ncbi:MAG: hypothetical protein IKE52_02485 [Mogibacterium sp.]|nr:hypothetical protein [Mogibacterium sp.]
MHIDDIRKAANKEKNKIKKQLREAKIPAHKMKILEATIDNVALMKAKLDELREQLISERAIVAYDNGGGQKGVRENPIFKRYESFFKTYSLGMSEIFDTLRDEEGDIDSKIDDKIKPRTVLDDVRDRKNEQG